ncbi:unnamed protein product [Owenia fusiformis]|uniref:Uncharacterized protein n=1 Tax=Owenia fusiformis TaxID=6347 RepID=A0A8J1Y337_OWEFU|nr:unnamed protein product [Owenia fusiformis]
MAQIGMVYFSFCVGMIALSLDHFEAGIAKGAGVEDVDKEQKEMEEKLNRVRRQFETTNPCSGMYLGCFEDRGMTCDELKTDSSTPGARDLPYLFSNPLDPALTIEICIDSLQTARIQVCWLTGGGLLFLWL